MRSTEVSKRLSLSSYQAVSCDLVALRSMSVAVASFTHAIIQIPINSSKARNAGLEHTQKQLEMAHKDCTHTAVHLWSMECTSHEVPAYPAGQEQISTAGALWPPWSKGLAVCMENEWSLQTHTNTNEPSSIGLWQEVTTEQKGISVSTCTRHWALYCKTPWPSLSSDWLKQSRIPFDLLAACSLQPGSSLAEARCDWYLVRRGTPAGQTVHQRSWSHLPGRERIKTGFLFLLLFWSLLLS